MNTQGTGDYKETRWQNICFSSCFRSEFHFREETYLKHLFTFTTGNPDKRRVCLFVRNIKKCMGEYCSK